MSTLVSFAATGVDQTWVVPPGVTSIEVDGAGAAGGDGNVVGHMDATDPAFVNVQSFNIRQNLTIPSASTPGTATIPSTMKVGDLLVVIAVEGGRTADPNLASRCVCEGIDFGDSQSHLVEYAQ